MNKIYIGMIISAMFFVCCKKEEKKPGENLPMEIKIYITTYYPIQLITGSITDLTDSTNTYEIGLDNASSLVFNYKKEIVEIEGNTELPSSVISIKIFEYVKVNYPNNFITGWKRDEDEQEIELNNQVELVFDLNNVFLEVD